MGTETCWTGRHALARPPSYGDHPAGGETTNPDWTGGSLRTSQPDNAQKVLPSFCCQLGGEDWLTEQGSHDPDALPD